jgi:hypothetical protein
LERDGEAKDTFLRSRFATIASELPCTPEAITAAAEDSIALDDDDVMKAIYAGAAQTGSLYLMAEETEEESS